MRYDNPTFARADGFRMATYPHGPEDGPPIVMLHGWPELAYSWSSTVPALTQAGYRAIPYDLLGYGRSDAPRELAHYRIEQLVAHLEAVLDHYDIEKAILLAHDWGGIILWHAVRILKHRTVAAISICTPHVGHAPVDPMKIFEKRYGKQHYFHRFVDAPDETEALFRSNVDAFFRMMFRTTPPGLEITPRLTHTPARFADYLAAGAPQSEGMLIGPDKIDVYRRAYERTNFLPGMNYYRNTTHNWEFAKGLSEQIDVPSLMISPADDFFLPPKSTHDMDRTVPDLTRVVIPDCGHWAMWDQPEAVNNAILAWLSERGF